MVFDCLENCASCCGNVAFTKECWEKNKSKIQVRNFEILPLPDGDLFVDTPNHVCVFLNRQTKKCVIYDERPEICKMFGINTLLPCPYLMPDGSKRTPEKMKEYEEVISKQFEDFERIKERILNKNRK